MQNVLANLTVSGRGYGLVGPGSTANGALRRAVEADRRPRRARRWSARWCATPWAGIRASPAPHGPAGRLPATREPRRRPPSWKEKSTGSDPPRRRRRRVISTPPPLPLQARKPGGRSRLRPRSLERPRGVGLMHDRRRFHRSVPAVGVVINRAGSAVIGGRCPDHRLERPRPVAGTCDRRSVTPNSDSSLWPDAVSRTGLFAEQINT